MNKMIFIADFLPDVIAVQRTMRTALISLAWRRHPESELSELLVEIETELSLQAVQMWLQSEPELAYLAQSLQLVPKNSDGFRENLKSVSRTWSALTGQGIIIIDDDQVGLR